MPCHVAHDPAAEAAWVASHDFIACSVARRRVRFAGRVDHIDDYRQTGRLALVEAYRRIDPGQPAEMQRAYAWTAVRRRTARLWMADESGGEAAVGGDEWAVEDEGRSAVAKVEDEDTVEYAMGELTEAEKDAIRSIYKLGWTTHMTIRQYADWNETSVSTVHRTLRSALDKMRRKLDREEAGR